MRIIIMIINRPILHIFDIFDLIYSTSNCKYRNRLQPKYLTVFKQRWTKNAIAYAEICGICANICEFLDMRHNFRICDFENAFIRGEMCRPL